MADLTTTSYLILGLLSSRDWSAYELAMHVGNGVTELWPRAGRQMYNAPKKLVEAGLVDAATEMTGRRARTVYSITPAGKTALRAWLSTEAQPPAMEFEGMLRVLFADEGTIEDLQDNLRLMAEQARVNLKLFGDHATFMLETDGGTFAERQHLLALANVFMVEHYAQIIDWAERALAAVEPWPDTASPATTRQADTRAALDRSLKIVAEHLGNPPRT